MSKNNKGFMLAEVVVSATIVLTALVTLYASFTRLYSLYEIRKTYYDIDGVYAMKGLIAHMLDTPPNSDNHLLNEILSSTNFPIFLIKSNICQNNLDGDSYCKSIQELYHVENLLIVKYDEKSIATYLENTKDTFHNTFKEYMDFILKNYDFSDQKYDYLMIMEYRNSNSDKENEEYYYASMGV